MGTDKAIPFASGSGQRHTGGSRERDWRYDGGLRPRVPTTKHVCIVPMRMIDD